MTTYFVKLGHIKNKTQWAPVASFTEASVLCQKYIQENDFGYHHWYGGRIVTNLQNKKPVARVSYNGRVWDMQENLLEEAASLAK